MLNRITNTWRILLSFSFVLFACNHLVAQSYFKNDKIVFRDNNYFYINDTLFAGELEVTNKEYKKFLSSLPAVEYEKCKIDSSFWKTKLDAPDTNMVRNYHSHPAFDMYPVVNISFYGAIKYCEWLTNQYKKRHGKSEITFKLPTGIEWFLLSNTNSKTRFPYNILTGKNSQGCYLENVKSMVGDSVSLSEDGGYYTVRVDAYWPSHYGLYNVIGNAAEMTNAQGIQMGGSWLDDLNDCFTYRIQTYTTPDPRVGFRVVAIVKRR